MVVRRVTKSPLKKRKPPAKRTLTLAEEIMAIGREIPAADRAKFPKDGARNLDHYLYGSPKQDN